MNNEELILLEIEQNFLDFDKLDKIFQNKLPKDIVKLIYDMIEPICSSCMNCCNICRIYCYMGCLRNESGRNVCNRPEFDREIYKITHPTEEKEEEKETMTE